MFDSNRIAFNLVAAVTLVLGLSLKIAMSESSGDSTASDGRNTANKYAAGKLRESGFEPHARRRLINANVYTAIVYSAASHDGNCPGDILLLDLPRNEEIKTLLSSIVKRGGGDVTYILNGIPYDSFPTFDVFMESRRTTLKRALGMEASFSHVAVASEMACDGLHDELRQERR